MFRPAFGTAAPTLAQLRAASPSSIRSARDFASAISAEPSSPDRLASLDTRGRLLQQILPDGATDVYLRDQAGQAFAHLDPLARVTLYNFAYGTSDGDLQSVIYPDGSFDVYTYELTFHHQTSDTNGLGETTSATYDPTTGDLLSSSDFVQSIKWGTRSGSCGASRRASRLRRMKHLAPGGKTPMTTWFSPGTEARAAFAHSWLCPVTPSCVRPNRCCRYSLGLQC
jgi:YD repeat-containing protein